MAIKIQGGTSTNLAAVDADGSVRVNPTQPITIKSAGSNNALVVDADGSLRANPTAPIAIKSGTSNNALVVDADGSLRANPTAPITIKSAAGNGLVIAADGSLLANPTGPVQIRSAAGNGLVIAADGSLLANPTVPAPLYARTPIIFSGTALAVGTSGTETLLTLAQQKGTAAATVNAGSYTITAGKKLRFSLIKLTQVGNATATAATCIVRLRLSTTGAATATSTPVLLPHRLAAGAVASSYTQSDLAFGDGWEPAAGDGTISIGFTVTPTFTLNPPTLDILAIGYEY